MTDMHKSAEVKQSDARSYDATAAEFGTLTERYSRGIAGRMLDLAAVTSGDRLLDLGTGTGLLARLAAARGANAIGIDHSAGMLGQAQARSDEDGVGARTQFLAMDAEALEFADEAFDVTVSLFVLRHLPNPLAAARETYRTLKSGGRLVTTVGARPSPFSVSGMTAASDRVKGKLGRLVLAPGSLRQFLQSKGIELRGDHAAHSHLGKVGNMLRSAGFRDVQRKWWGERHVLSPEEFWDVQAVFDSDARATLTALDEDTQRKLKRQYIAACDDHVRRRRKLVYRTGALIFTATR
jgi:ubiquinone/menaquinone biosynthesis C-methylase UbiE